MKKDSIKDSKYKKRLLLNYASTPMTLFPLMAGITAIAGSWALSLGGFPLFAGTALILGSTGSFLTNLIGGNEKIEKQIVEELQLEDHESHENDLNELEEKLMTTGDERTVNCLKDIRTLHSTFMYKKDWSEGLNATAVFDIINKVEDLFRATIFALKKNFEIWEAENKLATKVAKKPLKAKREIIITDIKESVEQLGQVLADLQTMDLTNGNANLDQLREELDENLEIARNVEKRMSNLKINNDMDFE